MNLAFLAPFFRRLFLLALFVLVGYIVGTGMSAHVSDTIAATEWGNIWVYFWMFLWPLGLFYHFMWWGIAVVVVIGVLYVAYFVIEHYQSRRPFRW